MKRTLIRIQRTGWLLLAGMSLVACTSTGVRQAPIVERAPATAPTTEAAPAETPPSKREAKEGTYVVQKGDTLRNIAAAFGVDPQDIARWNNLEDPNRLAIGQQLRVAPPGAAATAAPVTPATSAQARPLTPPVPGAAPVPGPTAAAPAVPATPAVPDAGLTWMWPLTGKVIEKFDEKRNKGIDISGREGDPVVAAGDGSVVYSGSGLRGYGNLVIVKHNDDFISAYAHNRQILVKQGQVVKRGQRIAEVGKTDATSPMLHFEIRRGGKPVDPLQYLPPR